MADHERQAAALLEKAAALVLACEHNKAVTAMDHALTEVMQGYLAACALEREET